MAHLLVIENWVEGTGRLLPYAIRKLGHEYTFVSRNLDHYKTLNSEVKHPIIELARNIIDSETNNVPQLIEHLAQQHKTLQFDGVLTICDYYVGTVAEVAKALNLPQAFSSNVVNIRKKHFVRQALQDANLPNPNFAIATNWEEAAAAANEIGYPLIIKPSDLASSAFVKLVSDESELKDAFDTLKDFTHNFREQEREPIWLLEEYMEGDEVSVEAYTVDNKTVVIGVTDKSLTGSPYFIEDGHMFPANLDQSLSTDIEQFVQQVLTAVGHDHGITHTEIKITNKGLRLVEINSRPGGNFIAELIEEVTGINMLNMQINLALAKAPEVNTPIAKHGSAAIKFLVPEEKDGIALKIKGLDKLDNNPHILRSQFKNIENLKITKPIDNACYLGHIITVDKSGNEARTYAEDALKNLSIAYQSDTKPSEKSEAVPA